MADSETLVQFGKSYPRCTARTCRTIAEEFVNTLPQRGQVHWNNVFEEVYKANIYISIANDSVEKHFVTYDVSKRALFDKYRLDCGGINI